MLSAFLLLWAGVAHAEPAASVEFVSGNTYVSDRNNVTRAAEKGMPLEAGQTISTQEGRVQIRFTDGGYFSLQPNSQFRIDEYRYSGNIDEDRMFVSLLKGALRTISGLVGKQNRAAYRLQTTVATIGIRGTEYALDLNSSLYGHVTQGAVEVCNGAGCLIVPGGRAFFVSAPSALPVFTDRRSMLSPTSAPAAAKALATTDNKGKSEGARNDDGPRLGAATDMKLPVNLTAPSRDDGPRSRLDAGGQVGQGLGQLGDPSRPQSEQRGNGQSLLTTIDTVVNPGGNTPQGKANGIGNGNSGPGGNDFDRLGGGPPAAGSRPGNGNGGLPPGLSIGNLPGVGNGSPVPGNGNGLGNNPNR